MTKTLLAVDDSATMRKVLEITFGGEDFRVLTADGAKEALAKGDERPDVLVVDTQLGGEDGYALAKELRRRHPSATLLLLASRYAPYDQARGRDAGADDFADKPFDTQQLIDKVRKVMSAKEASGGAPAAAGPVAHPTPSNIARAVVPAAAAAPAASAPAASALGRSTQPSLGGAAGSAAARTGTLLFGDGASPPTPQVAPRPAPSGPQVSSAARPAAASALPATVPQAAAAAKPAADAKPAPSAAIASAVNGQLAGKMQGLGLSAQQAEAVLALSREVVERVVWEVVPQLAETIIKEEIARLTRA